MFTYMKLCTQEGGGLNNPVFRTTWFADAPKCFVPSTVGVVDKTLSIEPSELEGGSGDESATEEKAGGGGGGGEEGSENGLQNGGKVRNISTSAKLKECVFLLTKTFIFDMCSVKLASLN